MVKLGVHAACFGIHPFVCNTCFKPFILPILVKRYNVISWNEEDLKRYFARRTLTSPFVFMEGSPEVVRTWLKRLLTSVELSSLEVCCCVFTRRIRKFQAFRQPEWKKVSHHREVGGCSFATFQVAIYPVGRWKSISSFPKWKFRDLVHVTNSGPITEPPEDTKLENFDLTTYKSFHKLPSVFSKSGWVERKLSHFELFRVLDISKALDGDLIKDSWNDHQLSDGSSMILNAAPGNVT